MISSVLFQPTTVKCDDTDYIESLNKTSTSYWVQAKNHQSLKSKERIHAVLLDSQKDLKIEKNLSQSDKFSGLIFLFSHGNAGNIQCNFQNELITFLRKYGSVFLYDYRGYGMSDTTQISEQSLIEDISSVLKLAKVDKPKKITLFIADDWKYKLFSIVKRNCKIREILVR